MGATFSSGAGVGLTGRRRVDMLKDMGTALPPKMDRSWRKSRIAARILLRHEAGRATPRDERLAGILSNDRGVTSRLIDQALYAFSGRPYRLGDASWKKA
jgi:hypothetical protein